jgi:hypothetical protein
MLCQIDRLIRFFSSIIKSKQMNIKALQSLKQLLVNFIINFLSPGLSIALVMVSITANSQGTNQVYEKFSVGDAMNLFSGLALSPDDKTVAISSNQSFPLYIFDWENMTVTAQFDVGNWYAGSRAEYSSKGNYILLNQLFYMDWAPNKDREVNFEIVDSKSGNRVKMFENYHDVTFTPDEQYALSLSSSEAEFWKLENGEKVKSFSIDQATNGIAASPNGKWIAVSHRTYMEDLQRNSMWINNKKNRTNLEKYKQNITIFDVATLQPLYTINEFYDIVYDLKYTQDGKYLLIYSIPHDKLQQTGRKSYVSVVNANTGEPLRNAFASMSVYEPDFKMSPDGKFFGIVSSGSKFPEIHVYDFKNSTMVDRLELSSRLFEKMNEGEFPPDGRISFVFLPDGESILLTFGNRLMKWTFNQSL